MFYHVELGTNKKFTRKNALQETMPQEAMTIKSCSNLKLNLKGFHEDNRKFTKEIATYGFFAAYNFASSNEKHRHFSLLQWREWNVFAFLFVLFY